MNKKYSLASLVAVVLVFVNTALFAATEPTKNIAGKAGAAGKNANAPLVLKPKQPLPKKVDRLIIIDRDTGDKNAEAVENDSAVQVHYTGWLYDPSKPDGKGEKFDASRDQRLPLPIGFFLNTGRVIKGWDLGLLGMRPRGLRTIIIPPSLAYGDKERPRIPANSTLIFDIELIDIVGKRDMTGSSVTKAAPAPASATPSPAPNPPVPPIPLPIKRLSPQEALPTAPENITTIDREMGDGAAAEAGNDVLVHYTGWLYDASLPEGKGKQFDTSRERNQLFRFKLGAGGVIKGWDQGVAGMKVKGKRTLIIPAEFGYGARGAGGGLIPPNANLIFDVELVELPPS